MTKLFFTNRKSIWLKIIIVILFFFFLIYVIQIREVKMVFVVASYVIIYIIYELIKSRIPILIITETEIIIIKVPLITRTYSRNAKMHIEEGNINIDNYVLDISNFPEPDRKTIINILTKQKSN